MSLEQWKILGVDNWGGHLYPKLSGGRILNRQVMFSRAFFVAGAMSLSLGGSALLRLRSVPTPLPAAARPVVSIFARVTRSIIRSTVVPTAEGLRTSVMRLPSRRPRMTRSSIKGSR